MLAGRVTSDTRTAVTTPTAKNPPRYSDGVNSPRRHMARITVIRAALAANSASTCRRRAHRLVRAPPDARMADTTPAAAAPRRSELACVSVPKYNREPSVSYGTLPATASVRIHHADATAPAT